MTESAAVRTMVTMETVCETPDECTPRNPRCYVCIAALAVFEHTRPAEVWAHQSELDREAWRRYALVILDNEKEPPPEGDGPGTGERP